jgi:hypothetical protein
MVAAEGMDDGSKRTGGNTVYSSPKATTIMRIYRK